MVDVSTDAVVRGRFDVSFVLFVDPPWRFRLHQQFEKQKFAAAIESASDLDEIKGVAAMLLKRYYQQLSATIAIAEGKLGWDCMYRQVFPVFSRSPDM